MNRLVELLKLDDEISYGQRVFGGCCCGCCVIFLGVELDGESEDIFMAMDGGLGCLYIYI